MSAAAHAWQLVDGRGDVTTCAVEPEADGWEVTVRYRDKVLHRSRHQQQGAAQQQIADLRQNLLTAGWLEPEQDGSFPRVDAPLDERA